MTMISGLPKGGGGGKDISWIASFVLLEYNQVRIHRGVICFKNAKDTRFG